VVTNGSHVDKGIVGPLFVRTIGFAMCRRVQEMRRAAATTASSRHAAMAR